jgi:hypothetical protein
VSAGPYSQARQYAEASATFDELVRRFGSTKEGREGLNFNAAALLRMGKPPMRSTNTRSTSPFPKWRKNRHGTPQHHRYLARGGETR